MPPPGSPSSMPPQRTRATPTSCGGCGPWLDHPCSWTMNMQMYPQKIVRVLERGRARSPSPVLIHCLPGDATRTRHHRLAPASACRRHSRGDRREATRQASVAPQSTGATGCSFDQVTRRSGALPPTKGRPGTSSTPRSTIAVRSCSDCVDTFDAQGYPHRSRRRRGREAPARGPCYVGSSPAAPPGRARQNATERVARRMPCGRPLDRRPSGVRGGVIVGAGRSIRLVPDRSRR